MATKQNNKNLLRSIKTLSIILKHFGEFSLRNGRGRAIFLCLRHGDSWGHLSWKNPDSNLAEVISL
jgi:hypothetical protein